MKVHVLWKINLGDAELRCVRLRSRCHARLEFDGHRPLKVIEHAREGYLNVQLMLKNVSDQSVNIKE